MKDILDSPKGSRQSKDRRIGETCVFKLGAKQ